MDTYYGLTQSDLDIIDSYHDAWPETKEGAQAMLYEICDAVLKVFSEDEFAQARIGAMLRWAKDYEGFQEKSPTLPTWILQRALDVAHSDATEADHMRMVVFIHGKRTDRNKALSGKV